MRDEDVQWGWELVTGQVRQLEFDIDSRERDWYLAIIGVSLDDLDRWRAKGWVSFDARSMERLTESLMNEIVFIRNLAQSFLSDAQVDALLKGLAKPYQYNPTRIAYSFAYGWVQPPPVLVQGEVDDFVRFHLRSWIEQKAEAGDVEILRELSSLLFSAVVKAKRNSSEESQDE